MIISCPECAGPFEVPDDRIAALVQVACPHCAFRMILDFAAANDPGLVEQGMQMASGFRSAADYHASVQLASPPHEAVEVEAEPVAAEATTGEAEPEAAEAAPEPVRVQPRAVEPRVRAEAPVRTRPEPVSPAAAPPRPLASTPSREPERPAAEVRPAVSEEARTEVHMLPRGGEKLVPVDIPPVGRAPVQRSDEDELAVSVPTPATEIVRTVVGHPPPPPNADEIAVDIDDDEGEQVAEPTADRPQAPPSASAADEAAHPAFGSDEDEDVPTMVVSPEAREAARREMEELAAARRSPEPEPEPEATPAGRERPRPPHTPPGRAKVASRDEEAITVASSDRLRRAEASDEAETTGRRPSAVDVSTSAGADEDDEVEAERMSTFGVVVVVLLLLVAGGLVGASIALNEDHSPDPRPLLEKLYRQHVKGEPATKAEPAAKADTKASPATK